METLGTRLQRARAIKKISQEKLASLVGKSSPTISHYEKDRFKPPLEDIKKLAIELGVTEQYLLFGNDVTSTNIASPKEVPERSDFATQAFRKAGNDRQAYGNA